MTSYSAIYQGKQHTKTVDKWVKYLKNEPIYAHYNRAKIFKLLRQRKEQKENPNRLTVGQCLGINAIFTKENPNPKKEKQKFGKCEQVVYDKVRDLMKGWNKKIEHRAILGD